uniref:Heavy metal-associated isoprenylated plant protein 8 n=1 Tax=Cicer arietinum TaxID=3827 RepID=A0A3Q7WW61_CICAR|nr:heavy metal-associated isoprenylated plant protein 8 [Cicer arietinum]
MGKKNKEHNNNQNNNNNNKEENNEKKEEKGGVVLKANIHCEGCSDQISKCLKDFEGINHIKIDRENQKIYLKGDIKDPSKVLERLQKKYSKSVELISPKPKSDNKQKKESEKKEQTKLKTIVLKMYIHCDGCESDVKRKIEKMEGVESVELNKENSHVTVKGSVESSKLVEFIKKKLGKHVEIVKEDGKRDQGKKDEGKNNNERDNGHVIMYSYPPQYSTQYLYPNQNFSDENAFACSIM